MTRDLNMSKAEYTSPWFQQNASGEENIDVSIIVQNASGEENNDVSIVIDPQDASQMQGVAAQNSCSNYEPRDEWEPERAVMFYAVPIILGVAQLILILHLFEVI